MPKPDHLKSEWELFKDQDVEGERKVPLRNTSWNPLVPNIDLPLGQTSVYQTISITSLPEFPVEFEEFTGAIDILSRDHSLASAPAEGVILTHEQAWRMKGITLGRLLHSFTLAPGEVTQVAVTSWERSSHGQTATQAAERERASQSAGRSREIHDVTKGVASSSGFGFSSADTTAHQSGGSAGGLSSLLTGVTVAGSHNSSSGSVVGFNVGHRNVSADSNEKIRQSTRQHASNVRSQRSVVVQEVAQSETEQFNTRVVANYNHTHALNMLYFEELQAYELSTLVKKAERCLFIPMDVIPFTYRQTIVDFAGPLAKTAKEMGKMGLAIALEEIEQLERLNEEVLNKANDAHTKASGYVRDVSARLQSAYEKAAEISANIAQSHRLVERLENRLRRLEHYETALSRRHFEWYQLDKEITSAIQKLEISTQIHTIKTELATAKAMDEANRVKGLSTASEIHHLKDELHVAREGANKVEVRKRAIEEASLHVHDDVMAQLEDQRLLFNQGIWAHMQPDQVAAMVADKEHQGVSLARTLDPNPVSIVGNYVGFRWPFAENDNADARAFHERFVEAIPEDSTRETIVLPTGGVFAEAVPGLSNSAEKLDLTKFWDWDDDTIPILPTQIANLHQVSRAQRQKQKVNPLGQSSVEIKAMPDAPAGPSHVLAAAISSAMFRDMSGGDVIEGLLSHAQKVTGEGAIEAQQNAHEQVKAFLDHVETMVPKVADFLEQQMTQQKGGSGGQSGGGKGGENASNIGGLQNALGEGEEGLDVEALLGEAAELGLFL